MSVYIAKSRQRFEIVFNNLFVERAKSRLKIIIYAYNMNTSQILLIPSLQCRYKGKLRIFNGREVQTHKNTITIIYRGWLGQHGPCYNTNTWPSFSNIRPSFSDSFLNGSAACYETNARPGLLINGHIKRFDNLVCKKQPSYI